MFAQFNRFCLEITKEQASTCFHPGPCDSDVYALSLVPAIRRQFAKIPPEDIAVELKEYGAWNEEDFKRPCRKHPANFMDRMRRHNGGAHMKKIFFPEECGLLTDCREAGHFKGKIFTVDEIRKKFRCDQYAVLCSSCGQYTPLKKGVSHVFKRTAKPGP